MLPFSGICFDAYGTLLEVRDDRRVTTRFSRQVAKRPGRSPLTVDITLQGALLERGVDAHLAQEIGQDAAIESASVAPLPGAMEAVAAARKAGLQVAIASNLSRDYAQPIRRWFPDITALQSFEIGFAKPDPGIYDAIRQILGPGRLLMVGDSRRCDHDGAIANGFDAVLIASNPVPNATTIQRIEHLPKALGWQ